MTDAIVSSSGNVFLDLGYSQEEAAILQMRAELHWYEAHGIGKKEIKRKRYLESRPSKEKSPQTG